MKALFFRVVGALALCWLLVSMLSCAHDQQLVSISIEPTVETFGAADIPVPLDAGLSVQLRALGHYIHPPVTKDITSEVTWGSNDIQMVTVNSTGLITATGGSCGGTLISATVQTNSSAGNRTSSGAIVTSTMQANVVCFTGSGGGSGPLLSVTFAGTGTGTVSFSPSGFICASSCTVSFASGTTVNVTATPNGIFGGWSGCDSVSSSGLVCTVNNLTAARDVVVTFN
jgi:hypothetical protein